ncbi:MAG: hypothetical protein DRJ62_02800 [Thermoprotei archaeon]|nr:MAG: hypothetical protein DRJ62_02800 [Thermoprotei archaeon]
MLEDLCNKCGVCSRQSVEACAVIGGLVVDSDVKRGEVLTLVKNGPSLKFNVMRVGDVKLLHVVSTMEKCLSDVERGELGGFLAERLLPPKIAVRGGEILESLELKAWREYVKQSISGLVLELRDLAFRALMNRRFFIADLIERRVKGLHPYEAIYVDIASSPKLDDAFKFMEKSLEKVLAGMSDVVEEVNGLYRLRPEVIREELQRSLSVRAQVKLARAAKSLIHGVQEALASTLNSYLNPIKHIAQLQASKRDELNPYLYLYIEDEGELTPLSEIAAKRLGADVEVVKGLGGLFNTVYLVNYKVRGEVVKAVIKSYREWRAFKWIPTALWGLGAVDYALSPGGRLRREYTAITKLRSLGFKVPKVFFVDWREKIMCREYVEGSPFSDILRRGSRGEVEEAARAVGLTLSEIHNLGLTLGDCKPGNFVLKGGEVYVVDLEQFGSKSEQSWDVAELISFSALNARSIDVYEAAVKSFAQGYLERGRVEVLKGSFKSAFIRVLSPIASPVMLKRAERIILEVAG